MDTHSMKSGFKTGAAFAVLLSVFFAVGCTSGARQAAEGVAHRRSPGGVIRSVGVVGRVLQAARWRRGAKENGAEAPSSPAEAGGQQLWHGSGRGRMRAG